MMTNNIIFLFQLFLDTESLGSQTIEEICMEWERYFITIKNNNSVYSVRCTYIKLLFFTL